MKRLLAALIFFSLIFSPVYAGQPLPAGAVLQEDSYVFTIEDAKKLMLKIEEMEKTIEVQEEKIKLYENLDENLSGQIVQLEDLIGIKDLQLDEYKNLHQLDIDRLGQLERRNNISNVERWGLFGLGIGVTIGAVLIADKIDDAVEIPNNNSLGNQSRSVPLIKF